MIKGFKQFVPSSVCLSCDGCCRFAYKEGCWNVKVADEEKGQIEGKKEKGKVLLPGVVDENGFLSTIINDNIRICYFLNSSNNTCGIYPARPFECQLYPFLLAKNDEKDFIAVHLSCPYIEKNQNSNSFEQYVNDLKNFLKEETAGCFLRRNNDVFRDYSEGGNKIEYLFEIFAGK